MNFTRRVGTQGQFLASFTWEKYESNQEGVFGWATFASSSGQDFHNLAGEKSLDGNDIPHQLVLSYTYRLPVGKGQRFLPNISRAEDAVLGGWEVSGITQFKDGFPVSIYNAVNNTSSNGNGQRPNQTGNPCAANQTYLNWLNPSVLSEPAPFTYGSAPRTEPHCYNPGTNNWDITAAKNFQITERWRAQLRAEMFDAFNHPLFYAVNTEYGSPAFGTSSRTLSPRIIQLALRVQF